MPVKQEHGYQLTTVVLAMIEFLQEFSCWHHVTNNHLFSISSWNKSARKGKNRSFKQHFVAVPQDVQCVFMTNPVEQIRANGEPSITDSSAWRNATQSAWNCSTKAISLCYNRCSLHDHFQINISIKVSLLHFVSSEKRGKGCRQRKTGKG